MTARSPSTDPAPGLRERFGTCVRFGFRLVTAANPPAIVATALLPRVVLQTLFWTLLGRVAAGPDGGRYAFIGAIAMSVTTQAVAGLTDPPVEDKWAGTYARLLRGSLPTWVVYLGRSIACWALAVLELIVCWVAVAALTGNGDTAADLVPAAPVLLLISVTIACAGYFCAAFCVGRRAEVAIYNLLIYLIIVCSNALIPRGRSAVIDTIGTVLPGTHGLVVIRAIADGTDWRVTDLLTEVAVGAAWLAAGIALHAWMAHRSRTTGSDSYS